jgi:IS605 OrfB family transposase
VEALNKRQVFFRGKHSTVGDLREMFVNKSSPLVQDEPWISEVPYDVRDGAVLEFVKNLQTELNKNLRCPSHVFRMTFKSRIDPSISIPVLRKHWKDGVWFSRFLPSRIRGFEDLPKVLPMDARMVMTRLRNFYLCIPKSAGPQLDGPSPTSIIALDPGVRTFLTGFDPSGQIIEFGKGDCEKIFMECRKVDKIMSKVNVAKNHKQRYQRKRASQRVRLGIKNKIRDLHHKVAKYLCENYKTIFLPTFATSQMVKRAERKIGSKVARAMMTFSHYSFRQCLLDKAKSYRGVEIHIVNESYTSRTCTRCGHDHEKLGGRKKFICPSCSLNIDRDINGARNIFIRSVEAIFNKVAFGA